MWTAARVLLGIFLIISVTTQSAMAQLGPWVEAAPAPVEQPVEQIVETEPVVETLEIAASGSVAQESEALVDSGSIPLGLPRVRSMDQPLGGVDEVTTPLKLGKEFVRTVATLAGVLMLIFALAHVYKRIARTKGGLSGQIGAGGRAPAGIVEVLGRYPISSGMTLVVLRFDRRVLLLSHAGGGRGGRKGFGGGAGSMQTLCEVGSAEEVASILGKVRDESGDSIAASFERTLQEAGNATDQEIAKAMYQPSPGVHVQSSQRPQGPRRIAPGFVTNDEGDRLELTSLNDSPAASQVLRRRLGAMRRGR